MGSEAGPAAHDRLHTFVVELPTFGSSHTLAVPSFRRSVELQAVVTEHFGGGLVVCGCQTNCPVLLDFMAQLVLSLCESTDSTLLMFHPLPKTQTWDRMLRKPAVLSATGAHTRNTAAVTPTVKPPTLRPSAGLQNFSKLRITQTFGILWSVCLCLLFFPLNLNVASS